MSSKHESARALLDERDIIAFAARYCRALDTKNWPLLDDVFLPDATAELGTSNLLVGREAIRGRVRAAIEYLDDSQHLVGNHEVSVDGDAGTIATAGPPHPPGARGSPHYMIAGRYEDHVAAHSRRLAHRTPHAHRHVERRATSPWSDPDPAPASSTRHHPTRSSPVASATGQRSVVRDAGSRRDQT